MRPRIHMLFHGVCPTHVLPRFARNLARRLAPLTACIAIVVGTGCATRHGQLIAFLNSHDTAVATGHYTVMPPDAVTIHAPGAPEIDGGRQTVRPDGKISLRLLGEVQVAGLTTQEIADKLEMQLGRYYRNPEVVVDVARYSSQHYFVFGEVVHPGPRLFTGRDTLLHALADARPNFLAWRNQIRVVRPSSDGGDSKTITVDLDAMVARGDTSQDVLLQPGDIIEVPPTPLAWVGLRVRELLYPIEPIVDTYTRPARALAANDYYNDRGTDNDTRVAVP